MLSDQESRTRILCNFRPTNCPRQRAPESKRCWPRHPDKEPMAWRKKVIHSPCLWPSQSGPRPPKTARLASTVSVLFETRKKASIPIFLSPWFRAKAISIHSDSYYTVPQLKEVLCSIQWNLVTLYTVFTQDCTLTSVLAHPAILTFI